MQKTHCFGATPQPDGTILITRLVSQDDGPAKGFIAVESWPISMPQAGIFATELFNAVRDAAMARVEFKTHGADLAINDLPPCTCDDAMARPNCDCAIHGGYGAKV